MSDIVIADTIAAFDRDEWNALFPDELEAHEYLCALETAGLEGFGWAYVAIRRGGTLIAAAPGFFTTYDLATTLTTLGKKVVGSLRRFAPGALSLRLGCLGSPCTETALLGFAPAVSAQERLALLTAMLKAFDAHARARGCGLLAVKDVPQSMRVLWQAALGPCGYKGVPGLPVASLDIDFSSVDGYLERLSAGTRKDMRRKLRARSGVRVERRHNIDDCLPEVAALYADTRGRAEMQLEELTPAYFRGVLAHAPGAACTLYFAGDRLLAANLTLEDGTTLLDKFFCMNAEAGRARNLYFLSWFANIEYCLAHGLKRYQSGQAGYANKLRLGSRLLTTQMYFRHRNPLISAVLQTLAPLFTGPLAPEGAQ